MKFCSLLIPLLPLKEKFSEKPKIGEEAVEMLQHLSGKTHKFTAVSFKSSEKIITKTDVADVEFSEITDQEINFLSKIIIHLKSWKLRNSGMVRHGKNLKKSMAVLHNYGIANTFGLRNFKRFRFLKIPYFY